MIRAGLKVAVITTVIVVAAVFSVSFYHNFMVENGKDMDVMDSIVEITSSDPKLGTVSGTGFIIEHEGQFVVTDAHIVAARVTGTIDTYDRITCSFADRDDIHDLELLTFDIDDDLAVLFFEEDVSYETSDLNLDRPRDERSLRGA